MDEALPKGTWKKLFTLLREKPALACFLADKEVLARIQSIFDREIGVAKASGKPEKRRAFPTGRDPRWPSKREQNEWPR